MSKDLHIFHILNILNFYDEDNKKSLKFPLYYESISSKDTFNIDLKFLKL